MTRIDPHEVYGVQFAAVADAGDKGALEEARQLTHDALIAEMGARRRGGVSWRWWSARTVLDDPGFAGLLAGAEYAELRGYLARCPEGLLVMATAPGDPPADAEEHQ